FNVYRTSQYWGNSHPYIQNANALYSLIEAYGNLFKSLGPPDSGCDEFFLYVTAHAAGAAMEIYAPDGQGNRFYPTYGAIYDKLLEFPSYIKVTIFLDGCYTGNAISHHKDGKIPQLCKKLCAFTIMTSTDANKSAVAPGIVWDSGTEDFMEGADLDLDGDGVNGDIQDRFKKMVEQNSALKPTNPQFYHCPEGGSWCSTDGAIGADDSTVTDTDGDGITDSEDNCSGTSNSDQSDGDNDGVGDVCDNCPDTANTDQADSDGNGTGDACEPSGAAFCSDPLFIPADSFFDVFFNISACDVSTDQLSLIPVLWSGLGHPPHERPLNWVSSFATGATGQLMLTPDQINLFNDSWPSSGMSNPPEDFTEDLLIGDEVSWFCGLKPGLAFTSVTENPLVFINVMHANLPENDPVNYYQYSFVFDRDGNTGNNYQPSASYPNDFYKDTDYWVELYYDPFWGWDMSVTDASNNSFTPVASEEMIIFVNNTLFLVIPRSVFLAQNIGYRMTAFRHTGDWGMNTDNWDGDVQPPVAEGLNWIDIGN
ncbi:MAG: thrombospondin type 3 repeat-containing protein, partial [Candidatus Neomarinimicrobiota bacterium]